MKPGPGMNDIPCGRIFYIQEAQNQLRLTINSQPSHESGEHIHPGERGDGESTQGENGEQVLDETDDHFKAPLLLFRSYMFSIRSCPGTRVFARLKG
ncbi:hypothetical protein GCM10011321_11910 [Youhaiella tibetensis]|nr:hypothetical protein GCM10011321_11910 [Youhaiella tibetensis]